jgi:hypothetical protein
MKILPPTEKDLRDARIFASKIRTLNERLLTPIVRRIGTVAKKGPAATREMLTRAEQKIVPQYSRAAEPMVRTFTKNVVAFYVYRISQILLKNHLHADSRFPRTEVRTMQKNCLADIVKIVRGFFRRLFRDLTEGSAAGLFREKRFPLEKILRRADEILKMADGQTVFVSRTHTSRMLCAVDTIQYMRAGLSSYVWSTARDRRVVGNPLGLYPRGNPCHEDHFSRDGKTFGFDTPPGDGPPGWAYNCRCVAQPVLRRSPFRMRRPGHA